MGYTTLSSSCGDADDHPLLLLLPEDVLISILLCLPVKSLLRFKSACKSWRELIQSSFFIDLHTTTFINSSSSSSKFGNTFILQATEYSREKYEDGIKLFMLSSSELSGDGDGDGPDGDDNAEDDDDDHQKKKMGLVFKVDDLGFSAIYKDFQLEDSLRMVGSCNGIICLHDPRGVINQHYSNLRDVSLWNPATRQFRILPKSIPIEERKNYTYKYEDFIGFGFDIETKDHKLLRITPCRVDINSRMGGGCMARVQVYSLSTDSWRLLEDINLLPVLPKQENHGVYLNGSYFFVGTKLYTDDRRLLSFDFTKEILTTMQLPGREIDIRYKKLVISSLGDKIAAFTRTGFDDDCDGGYEYYDIWVLNEQQQGIGRRGVMNKEFSWTKLHSFRIKKSRELLWSSHTGPRCISNNGEFVLISTITDDDGTRIRMNKLQLFNLVTKEVVKDFTIGYRDCRAADVYKESLVSIMGGGNVLLRWQLPTHGTTYKLNLDAPFIDSFSPFGIGLCLISDTGGCIGVRSLRRRNVRDATQGEAMAMLEAIKWAKKLELSPIIIESDSKNVVSFFMDNGDNNSTYWSSEALSLLREAKLILNSSELGGISLKYCSRSCNYVADIAAKLGREGLTLFCMDWTANFPGEMVMSLSSDLSLSGS